MIFPQNLTISSHTIQIRPRYAETDKGGVVHHSVYPVWLEMGRTELLRVNGTAYKDLEESGIYFVIVEMRIKYRRPALYDQQLELTTWCSEVTAARIEHSYRLVFNGLVLAEADTTLACIDKDGKAQRIPKFLYPDDK